MKELTESSLKDLLDRCELARTEGSIEAFQDLKESLYDYVIPVAVAYKPTGSFFFRVRSHNKILEPFDSNCIDDISQLGHRRDSEKIETFGRANEPGQSRFYSATHRHISYFETTKVGRELEDIEQEVYTISEWTAKRSLRIAFFPTNVLNRGKNKEAEFLNEQFRRIFSKYREINMTPVFKLYDYLSTEFSKLVERHNDYLISAAFSSYIFNKLFLDLERNKESQIDGIAYPSVRWDSEGLNYVFRKELVEDRDLELRVAACQKNVKTGEKTYKETDTINSKRVDYEKGLIDWKDQIE
jgi:hypothetical protein